MLGPILNKKFFICFFIINYSVDSVITTTLSFYVYVNPFK